MLIALEGIDGSGKGTQAALLQDRFRNAGKGATVISFPRYAETNFGRAIGDFLNGRFGPLDQVSPYLAAALYAGDRFESRDRLCEATAANDAVILDRYVASNVAHQGAKLRGREHQELIRWIERIEYDVYRLPRPDLTLLLDMPAETAQQLVGKKSARSYTDRTADIQEADAEYLAGVRELYLSVAQSDSSWRVVQCVRGDNLREPEQIGEEIWDLVQAVCAAKKS